MAAAQSGWQQPGQSGQDRAVGPVRLRPDHLAAENHDLMAQHQDLRILGRLAPAQSMYSRPCGLRDKQVHVAVVRPPLGLPGLVSVELATERLVASLPDDHPLAERSSWCKRPGVTFVPIADLAAVANGVRAADQPARPRSKERNATTTHG